MLQRHQIGERVAARRDSMNMTQEQLAQLLGINRPRLSGIERGTRPLDAAVLSKLSQALGVSAGYLLGLEKPSEVETAPVLRFRAQLESDHRAAELSGLLTFLDRYRKLTHWAKEPIPEVDIRHMPYASNLRHYASEGDAGRLRDAWGLGDAPIGLDIFELLEDRGIGVYRQAFPAEDKADVSGAYFRDDEVGPILFINAREWPYRQVFTAAHELAHLIYDQQSGYSLNLATTSEERMCNRFASAFLMPKTAIEAHLSRRETRRERIERDDVLSLQRAFGVSYGAMLVRLKSLTILKPDRYDELKTIHPVEEAVKHGYVVASWEYGYDADRVSPEERLAWLPRRYLQLVRWAVREGLLSDRKAADYANMEYEEWLYLVRSSERSAAAPGRERDLHRRDLEDSEVLVSS